MKIKHEGREYWRDTEGTWVRWDSDTEFETVDDPNTAALLNIKASVREFAISEARKTLRCFLWCAVWVAACWAASEITTHFARLGAAESRPR